MPASDPYAYIVGPGGTDGLLLQPVARQREAGSDDEVSPVSQTGGSRVPGYPVRRLLRRPLARGLHATPGRGPWLDRLPGSTSSTASTVFSRPPDARRSEPTSVSRPTAPRPGPSMVTSVRGSGPTAPSRSFPNLLTGSNIDIQLAEDLRGSSPRASMSSRSCA